VSEVLQGETQWEFCRVGLDAAVQFQVLGQSRPIESTAQSFSRCTSLPYLQGRYFAIDYLAEYEWFNGLYENVSNAASLLSPRPYIRVA
jgi:hypothetical protein